MATRCAFQQRPANATVLCYGAPFCEPQTSCLVSNTCAQTPFQPVTENGTFVGSFDAVGNFSLFPGPNLTFASSQPLQVDVMTLPSSLVSLDLHNATSIPSALPSTLKRLAFHSPNVTSLRDQQWTSLTHIDLVDTPLTSLSNWSVGTNLTSFLCSRCAFSSFFVTPDTYTILAYTTTFSVRSILFASDACAASFGTKLMLHSQYPVCVIGPPPSSHGGTIAAVVVVVVLLLLGLFVLKRQRRRASHYHDQGDDEADDAGDVSEDILAPLLPYRLDTSVEFNAKLGEGTFGQVWLACLRNQDDVVAVKTLRPERRTAPRILTAFVAEIHLLARLHSPDIVGFVGVVWSSQHPARVKCVMEYMDKGDLRAFLRKNALGLSWHFKCQYVALPVARALAYLHARGILHRDVKSRNVLLHSTLGAKLSDFGVASSEESGAISSKAVGTLGYMAPEIMSQHRHSPAGDVFALGVVLKELDSHQLPTDHGVEFTAECPSWVRALVVQCADPEPERRPTAAQVVEIIADATERLDESKLQTP
ncbi:Aste57867_15958 [Aphanomyces stellatus]|uniref:Aste57867_15958 protein n=1 Tax=Aphanomyces stellatus TaxID=120398 RepID=A0A485L7G7_9STRA|nr:hypothetical protein As57867_015902 [Aphanomyces stellatus]VFT92743.1 Aste57867_15958 [Aphanomyces stellatus]